MAGAAAASRPRSPLSPRPARLGRCGGSAAGGTARCAEQGAGQSSLPTPGPVLVPVLRPDARVPYREPEAPAARAGAAGLPGAWCWLQPRPGPGRGGRAGGSVGRGRGAQSRVPRGEGAGAGPPPSLPPPAPDRISTTASAWRRRRGSPSGPGGGGARGAAYRKVSSKGAEDPAAGAQGTAASSSGEALPC